LDAISVDPPNVQRQAALKPSPANDTRQLLKRAQVTMEELTKATHPGSKPRLDSIAQQVISRFDGIEAKLDVWFESTMDRVNATVHAERPRVGGRIAVIIALYASPRSWCASAILGAATRLVSRA
jgi:hypothetical protein